MVFYQYSIFKIPSFSSNMSGPHARPTSCVREVNPIFISKLKMQITWSIFFQIKKLTPQNRKSRRAQLIGQGPNGKEILFCFRMQFVRQKHGMKTICTCIPIVYLDHILNLQISKKKFHPLIQNEGGSFLEVKNFKNLHPKEIFHPNFFFKIHQFLVISDIDGMLDMQYISRFCDHIW